MRLYADSIYSGENLIGYFNEEYSSRLNSFLTNLASLDYVASAQHNIIVSEYGYLQESLAYARIEMQFLRLLSDSVLNSQNLFYGVNIAQLSDRQLVGFNTHLNRYLNHTLDIYSRDSQIQNILYTLYGHKSIRDSIITGEDLFTTSNVYRSMYDEYRIRYRQLLDLYIVASDTYLRNSELFLVGAISSESLSRLAIDVNTALFNKNEFTENFMIRINNEIRDADNRLLLARSQREMANTTLASTVSNQIFEKESSIENINQRINDNRLRQVAVFFYGQELGDISIRRFEEINRALGQLANIEQELFNISLAIYTLQDEIENATVRAQINGEINSRMEITEGSFLPINTQVLDIIPSENEFLTANIHVSNRHIGRLEEGMLVRYSIAALPRREFGNINGYVYRIAPDITYNQDTAGYFVVESHLEDRVYYNTDGEGVSLRVGMAFDARIVVDRERILFHLLDQINLLFN